MSAEPNHLKPADLNDSEFTQFTLYLISYYNCNVTWLV